MWDFFYVAMELRWCQVTQYSWNMFILRGRGELKRKTMTVYSAKENRFHPKEIMKNH